MIEELRAAWRDAGPIVDDADRAQQAHFDDVVARVLGGASSPSPTPIATTPTTAMTVPEGPKATVLSAHDAPRNPCACRRRLPDVRASRCPRHRRPPPMMSTVAADLGEDDPTASATTTAEHAAPPNATEMAGDGATGGDGITDDSGWD